MAAKFTSIRINRKKYSRAIQQISMFLREKGYIDSTIFNLKTSEDLKNKIEIYFC